MLEAVQGYFMEAVTVMTNKKFLESCVALWM